MNLSIAFLLLFYKALISFGEKCPGNSDKYIWRDGIYCQKIYNCPPGHEIVACVRNCTPELCQSCSDGKVQPFQIHSSTTPVTNRECFRPQKECEDIDLVPIRNGTASPACAKADVCQCDLSNCWYGRNPCSCERYYDQCPEDEYLFVDGNSPSCKKCPYGTRKKGKGCGPCEVIDSFSQNMTATAPAMTVSVTSEISSLPSIVNNTADTSKSVHVLWTVIGTGLPVVVVVVLVVLSICLRRKCRFCTPKRRGISDEENVNSAEDNQKEDDTENAIPIGSFTPLIMSDSKEDLISHTPKSPIVSETEQPGAFHPCDPRALRQRPFNDQGSSLEDDSYTTNYPETTEVSEETNLSNQQSYTDTPLVDTIERTEGVDYILNKLNEDNCEVKQPVQCEEETLNSQTSQKFPHSDFTHQKELCDQVFQSLTDEKLLCSTQISDKTDLKTHIDSFHEITQQRDKPS
ncbi:uncharacterized protein LOC133205543 isoform X2 [Saccostrea echinata]|uniref:uncharacterized protein LOC133205543 isoform X2 n=1 Tax=Saccostrea echinata TaxID=191078 RepID=UPI002A80E717|nr:uncharacterized protein LOC133205543 isoform X2 [Saccostrea echinata]